MRNRGLAGAVCTVLAVAACSGSPGEAADGTPSPSPSATSAPTGTSGASQRRDDLRAALFAKRGRDFETIARIRTERPHGLDQGEIAVTPRGDFVATVYKRPDHEDTDTQGIDLPPQRMALLDPRTGDLDYLPEPDVPGPNRQASGAVATDRWVVWTETSSTDLFTDPWQMFSYDRRDGQHIWRTHR